MAPIRQKLLSLSAAVGVTAATLLVVGSQTSAATAPAVDDVLTSNPVGESTVIEVLINDEPGVDPASLMLVDPVSGEELHRHCRGRRDVVGGHGLGQRTVA